MTLEPPAAYVLPPAACRLRHPGAFALRILKGFRANQGLLLASAVACYALLSIVPRLILIVIALSHGVEQSALLDSLNRYIARLALGEPSFIVNELTNFLNHREVMGWGLLGTLLCFSSLAFTVLENAMSVILLHRVAIRQRQLSPRRALIGGITAALLWEVMRHLLVGYFATLSQVGLVHGALTTAIVVLLSLEIAAPLLPLGAQVISEYERIGTVGPDAPALPLHTGRASGVEHSQIPTTLRCPG